MSGLLVVGALAVAFLALFVVGLAQGTPDPLALLRSRYLRLRNLGTRDGRRELAARLSIARRRFPGHNELWCLRWLVEELERNRS